MIGKRLIAHILNKIILLFPSLYLLAAICLMIAPNYFIFGKDESGWLMVYLYRYLLCLPLAFYDLIRSHLTFSSIIFVLMPALMCFIFLEIITILVIKRHIGMKIMGLKIVSIHNKPLSLLQIVVRTIMKYLSLAFFPFALIYIFRNEERIAFHDKISGVKVVKK